MFLIDIHTNHKLLGNVVKLEVLLYVNVSQNPMFLMPSTWRAPETEEMIHE